MMFVIGPVTCLRFYGATHLFSGSEDHTICVWKAREWECLAVLEGHT